MTSWNLCVADIRCAPLPSGQAAGAASPARAADVGPYLAWLNGRTGGNYRLPRGDEFQAATAILRASAGSNSLVYRDGRFGIRNPAGLGERAIMPQAANAGFTFRLVE